MATIQAKVNGTWTTLENVDLSAGVTIEDIEASEEWELTTIDDTPATYVTPHIGGRPDDRN